MRFLPNLTLRRRVATRVDLPAFACKNCTACDSADFDALAATVRSRFAEAIQLDHPPATNGPALTLKAWRARHALLRDGMRGMDGEFYNSPLWDPHAALDATTGCGWLPPVASVALNSFLFWDANHLAVLAEKQGLSADAVAHRARAVQLQRDLFAICYVPEEKRFWDFNHHTGLHRKVKTFYMFRPLFAGMDVPLETVRDLIENVLLDPNQFFGEIPFPSIAYDEPTHDSKGYWRGRAWPHITYWLLQMLVRHGYIAEAKEAARRTITAYGRSAGFPENIATRPADFDAAGFTDYNWGCAAFYLIATEQYLKLS